MSTRVYLREHYKITLKTKADALADGNQKKHLLALIAVAHYMIANGPVVKTQGAGDLYTSKKDLETHVVKVSMQLYEIFSQHLNIVQVYMFSRTYLVPNTPNLKEILLSLISISHDEAIVKDIASGRLKDIYVPVLMYMDSHQDKQILKGLMAELTNTSCTSRLDNSSS